MTEDNLLKSVGLRFLRGFIAGAVAQMAMITVYATNLAELETALVSLAFAAITGGITGAILAADKYLRSLPSEH